MLWLIIVLAVLAVLVVGGIIARNRQLASTRPAFERALAYRHPALPRPGPAERDAMLSMPDSTLLTYLTQLTGHAPLPLVLLFELSIWLSVLMERRWSRDWGEDLAGAGTP